MKFIGIFTTAAVTTTVVAIAGTIAFAAGAFYGMALNTDTYKTVVGSLNKDSNS
jgi:hypothetical protein